MRRGKEIAQGSHASSAWLAALIAPLCEKNEAAGMTLGASDIDEAGRVWLTTSFRKVTLQVRGEDELMALHNHAMRLGLKSHLIRDSGKTEFNGTPTYTALAIGPDLATVIDEVTGALAIY
jgi:peptidyl-tRNA hydrolase, PTH2 family